MKKLLFIVGIGTVSVLSANQYYYSQPGYGYSQQGYYPSGQWDQGYQGQYYYPQQQQYYQLPHSQNDYQQNRYGQYPQMNQPQGQSYSQGGYYQPQAGNMNVQYQQADTSNLAQDHEIAKEVHDTVSSGWFSKGYENVSFDSNNGVVTLRGSVESNDDKAKIEDSVRKIKGVKQVINQITVTGPRSDRNQQSGNYRDQQQGRMNQTSSWGWGNDDEKRSNQSWSANEDQSRMNQSWSANQDPSRMNQDQSRMSQSNPDKGWGTTSSATKENKFPQDYAATESDRQLNSKIRDNLGSGWFGPDYSMVIIKTSNGVVTILGSVEKPEDAQKAQDTIRKIEGVRSINNQLSVQRNK